MFIRDGLDTKNNKTRVVCAEEIGSIIDQEGPTVYRVNRQVRVVWTKVWAQCSAVWTDRWGWW